MKLQKKIEEIKFTDCDVWGTVMSVSENIVMADCRWVVCRCSLQRPRLWGNGCAFR